MPYCLPHYLIRAEGRFGTAQTMFEHWSIGYRLVAFKTADSDDVDPNNPCPTIDAASYVLGPAMSWVTAMIANGSIAGNVRLDYVKCNLIGYDGKYADDSSSHTFNVPTDIPLVTGGAGPNTASPFQLAAVVSTRTRASRGLAAKGRVYLPGPVTPVGVDGRVPDAYAVALANDAITAYEAAAFKTVDGAKTTYYRPAVVSMTATRPSGGPAGGNPGDWAGGPAGDWSTFATPPVRQITHVAVGHVLDTQQRRRKGENEDYHVEAITYAP